jgi:polysaccharide deacetylase 2 family uncharacterized protein YibQ
MISGGKSLGIVAGLAVGVCAGVLLAALNPVLPNRDETKIALTPVAGELTSGPVQSSENTAPDLGLSEITTPKAEAIAALPQQPVVNEPLVAIELQNPTPHASDIAELTTHGATETTEPEIVLPVANAAPKNTNLAAESLAANEASESIPLVSSKPADPIMLDQPLAETESPDLNQAELATDTPLPSIVVAAGVSQQTSASSTLPISLETTDTTSGTLPAIAGTAAQPAPENAIESAPLKQPTTPIDVTEPAPVAESTTPIDVTEPAPTPEPTTIDVSEPAPNTEPAALVDETEPVAPTDSEVAAAPITKEENNRSGTFKTQGSLLQSDAQSTDNRLATLGTGGGVSKRLPSIGASSQTESIEVEPAEIDEEPKIGALWANANPFEPIDGPVMSIVLTDEGLPLDQMSALSAAGLPLAIAVLLDTPDAAARASAVRAAGFEVLVVSPRDVSLSLSGGQSSAQIATLLARYFEIAPGALGLIDRPTANLQKDQKLVRAVVEHFAQTGHALVTYTGGLNAAARIADQKNVPTGQIFTTLDADSLDMTLFNRQMNRAAREAASKGQVILLGSASPATVAALVGWSLGAGSKSITIVPVSFALMNSLN